MKEPREGEIPLRKNFLRHSPSFLARSRGSGRCRGYSRLSRPIPFFSVLLIRALFLLLLLFIIRIVRVWVQLQQDRMSARLARAQLLRTHFSVEQTLVVFALFLVAPFCLLVYLIVVVFRVEVFSL